MNAESLMHERGTVAVVAHKDAFTREEKDALRAAMVDGTIQFTGQHYMLLIAEEPDDEVDALALAAYEEFENDERQTGGVVTVDLSTVDSGAFVETLRQSVKTPEIVEVAPGGEPTMADLRALKMDQLRKLADSEDVDLTGLKLKDDILGRLAAHFGLNPADD